MLPNNSLPSSSPWGIVLCGFNQIGCFHMRNFSEFLLFEFHSPPLIKEKVWNLFVNYYINSLKATYFRLFWLSISTCSPKTWKTMFSYKICQWKLLQFPCSNWLYFEACLIETTVSVIILCMETIDSKGILSVIEWSMMLRATVRMLPSVTISSPFILGLSGKIAKPEGKIATLSGFPPRKTTDIAKTSTGA